MPAEMDSHIASICSLIRRCFLKMLFPISSAPSLISRGASWRYPLHTAVENGREWQIVTELSCRSVGGGPRTCGTKLVRPGAIVLLRQHILLVLRLGIDIGNIT
jgi:hypothetical protein